VFSFILSVRTGVSGCRARREAAPFGYSKQATSNAAMRPETPRSLRVVSQCPACGVAHLANGITIGVVARLADRALGYNASDKTNENTP